MKTSMITALALAAVLSTGAQADTTAAPESGENCAKALREHFRDDASRTVRTELAHSFGRQMQDLQAQFAPADHLLAALGDVAAGNRWRHAD